MVRAQFAKYINPVVTALRKLGGSGRPDEVEVLVAEQLGLSDEALNATNQSGQSKFENQVAWARFYLAKDGFIGSPRHGVWTLTEKGMATHELNDEELNALMQRVQANRPAPPPLASPPIAAACFARH